MHTKSNILYKYRAICTFIQMGMCNVIRKGKVKIPDMAN